MADQHQDRGPADERMRRIYVLVLVVEVVVVAALWSFSQYFSR